MILGKVTKVYYDTQRVDVQPCITVKIRDDNSKNKMYTRTGEYIGVKEIAMPEILNVPFMYLKSGTFSITIPIAVGTTGILIISQQDISVWKDTGGTGVAGKDISLFDLNNAVFIAGVPDAISALSDYSSSALELRAGNDKISMDGSGTINITGNLTVSGTVTGTTEVKAGTKSLKAHTHPVTTAPGTTGVNN